MQPGKRPPFESVILAGGAGARFGGGKLLAPYRGGRLLDGALRAALSAPVQRAILVTGFEGEAVREAALSFVGADHAGARLDIIHAADHAEGMAASLRAGIAAVSRGAAGAFIFLGDMPDIPPSVAQRLAGRLGDHAAAAPFYAGRRGHPVLVAARLFPALARLSGDQGARAALAGLGDDLVQVEVEDGRIFFDVDLRSDIGL
ncbi:MAG: nucleotidyltransferase family protein [Caulobacteraceae bacterium]|nr:nucleotidyltransferase family protein [Caulobacteraceae bacterium]